MPENDMSVGELGRMLTDFRREMRGRLDGLVRLDLFRAEQNTSRAELETVRVRVDALEKAGERSDAHRQATNRLMIGVLATAGASLLVSLLMLALGGPGSG